MIPYDGMTCICLFWCFLLKQAVTSYRDNIQVLQILTNFWLVFCWFDLLNKLIFECKWFIKLKVTIPHNYTSTVVHEQRFEKALWRSSKRNRIKVKIYNMNNTNWNVQWHNYWGRVGEVYPALCPGFGKKCPDCVHL